MVGGAAVASGALLAGVSPETAAAQTAAPVKLEAYDPTGAFQITQTFAARLGDLNGKTIVEVSDDSWQADRTFPLIRQLLQKQFPTVNIITWDKMPVLDTKVDVPGLEDAVKKAGAQGAIVGNAG